MNILKKTAFFSFFLFFSFFFQVDRVMAVYNVGYRSVSTWDQKENIRVDVSLWYPTQRMPSEFNLGDYLIFAGKDAPILQIPNEEFAPAVRIERDRIRKEAEAAGNTPWEILQLLKKAPIPYLPYPLILISHDSGATRYSNHTLAQALAKAGFMVAMPMHEGDNAKQMSLLYSARSATLRASQISKTLDLLLSDKVLSTFIDRNNITFLGLGGSASAGLLFTGAQRTSLLWQDYCEKNFTIRDNDFFPSLSPLEQNLSGIAVSSQNKNTSLMTILPPDFSESAYDVRSQKIEQDLKNKKIVLIENGQFFLDEKRIDPYCLAPVKANIDFLTTDLDIYHQYTDMTNTYYNNITKSREEKLKANKETIEKSVATSKRQNKALAEYIAPPPFILPYFPKFESEKPLEDDRFSQMIFISPGYSILYDKKGLSQINMPMLFIGLEDDTVNVPEYQSEVFVKAINGELAILSNPKQLPMQIDDEQAQEKAVSLQNEIEIKNNAKYVLLKNTDIWGLQAPCNDENPVVEICHTVSESTRKKVLAELTELILDFLADTEKQ